MKKDIEKLKINLENLIKQAIENGDKVYIKSGDILISENGYIDERTIVDKSTGLHIVKPITFENDYYKYICPECGEIHIIHKVRISRNKPIKKGCCEVRSHSYRICLINGKLTKIKTSKIILNVEEC